MTPEKREICQIEGVVDIERAIGGFCQLLQHNQVGFVHTQRGQHNRVVRGDALRRRQVGRATGDLESGVKGIDQASVQKELLIEAILSFLKGIGKVAGAVEGVEQGADLFNAALAAKSLFQTGEIEEFE